MHCRDVHLETERYDSTGGGPEGLTSGPTRSAARLQSMVRRLADDTRNGRAVRSTGLLHSVCSATLMVIQAGSLTSAEFGLAGHTPRR